MLLSVHTSNSAVQQVAKDDNTLVVNRSKSISFGAYHPFAKLGEGGMGDVYLAVRHDSHNLVAIKLLHKKRWNDARAIARFQQEINVTSRFNHPNVVRSLETSQPGDVPFLALEYLDGIDLSRLLDYCGSLRIVDACEIARQIALGLEHIHSHGAVHRDIKPSNALLTHNGRVKIIDMGLALLSEQNTEDEDPAYSEQLVGTFDYMAPEQANDSRSVNQAADLYGVGATLFQLLSGEPPFAGVDFDSPVKKLEAHAGRQAPCIKRRRSDVPLELAAIVARLLAKDPADRFTSAAGLAVALEPFAHGSNLEALTSDASGLVRMLDVGDRAAKGTSNDCSSPTIDFSG